MQNKILSVLIAATLVTCGARAENEPTAPSQPPTPQPVATAPQYSGTQASAVSQAAPTPNQVIYSPRLPSATELTNAAAAQGLSIEQINQTSTQVTVIYRNASGQTSTVAYQLLPTASAPATTVAVPSAAPTVIYQRPRVIYYDSYDPWYPGYYPGYYYPPVSLSLGFGFYHGGWGHGGWGHGGGFHHWR